MLYYSWGGSWANRGGQATSGRVGDTWPSLASTAWKYALLLYLLYFLLLDNTPNTTGWSSTTAAMGFLRPILRNNVVYRWMALYFPVTLHKTGDIPAEAKEADAASPSPLGPPYIFCYHPHGVISVGWNLGLNTNAAGFDELFPGLQNRFGVTL
jgi:Diacylglycerol acyltransferase